MPRAWRELAELCGVEIEEALRVAGRGTAGYHVSLDMDWIDPEDAPGVGTPVRGGVTYRVPSPTELLWTATAHALLIPDLAFFLVRLLDTALLWASGAAIDWDEVARRLDAKEIVDGAAAAAWLGAARVLAGQEELPAALAGRVTPYDLSRELRLRLAVLRRVTVPAGWRKALAWWSSEVARR